jgi:hypothetical protein
MFRVQLNPRREGRWQGGGDPVYAESAEAALRGLHDALPGDALWVELAEDEPDTGPRFVYTVETGPRGLRLISS